MLDTHPCPSVGADHLSFSHSGAGINCLVSSITLSAHTADTPVHDIDVSYTGTVNLTTSTRMVTGVILVGVIVPTFVILMVVSDPIPLMAANQEKSNWGFLILLLRP
jgi:hypothetical protein